MAGLVVVDASTPILSLVNPITEGPQGPAGEQGPPGPQGEPGANGTDAEVTGTNVRTALSTLNTVAASGATETLVLGVNDVTMDQNCEFTFPTVGAGYWEFTLILSGAFTPTFPPSVDWPSATAPTYASPTEYNFATTDSGTTWRGVAAVGFA